MANIIQTISGSIKNWWIPLVIGVIFIALGIYTFVQPDLAYLSEVMVFDIAFIVLGVMEIYYAISNRKSLQGWGWYLTGGILSIVAGTALLVNIQIGAVILPYFMALLLLYRSIQGLGISFDLKSYGLLSWGNVAIASVIGIIFSFLLLIYPQMNVAFLITLLGLGLIFVGIIGILIGYSLNRVKTAPKRLSKELQKRIEDLQKDVKEELNKFKDNVAAATADKPSKN